VNTTTNDTLVAADIYNCQNSLGPRWQPGARWALNLATINALAQQETSAGALKFPSLQSSTPTLLNRPVHELSNMDGVIDSGQANAIGLYGDFSQYVITQRVGSSVELIPHLFGANRRPTGQRGMLLWGRWGADSINDSAFRLLVA
jgi:HK97 family phage major capsid protein